MAYQYGDLCIKKEKLESFLRQIPLGEYRTFDILKRYQGDLKRNEGINVGGSWNAHFGKILNCCAEQTNGIIENIAKNKGTIVGGGATTTAEWRILENN